MQIYSIHQLKDTEYFTRFKKKKIHLSSAVKKYLPGRNTAVLKTKGWNPSKKMDVNFKTTPKR